MGIIIAYKIKRFDTGEEFTVKIPIDELEYGGLGSYLVDNDYFDCLGHDSDYFEVLNRYIEQF